MWLFGIVLSKLWPFIWESRDLQKFTFGSYREKNMMLQLCLLLIDRIKSCGYQQPDDAMFSRKTWQIGSSLLAALGCSSTMMVAEIGSKPSHGWGDGVGHHIEFCWPFDGWWYDPFFFEWVTTSHDVGMLGPTPRILIPMSDAQTYQTLLPWQLSGRARLATCYLEKRSWS